MSLTNKLFSLLGFAEPVALKRFNGNNLFPNKALLLNIAKQVNSELSQVLAQLPFDVIGRLALPDFQDMIDTFEEHGRPVGVQ